jgi:hypothetical protein
VPALEDDDGRVSETYRLTEGAVDGNSGARPPAREPAKFLVGTVIIAMRTALAMQSVSHGGGKSDAHHLIAAAGRLGQVGLVFTGGQRGPACASRG